MTASSKDVATIAILDTKLDGAVAQISELKGRFDTFQASFIRSDLYNIKHEELVRQVTLNTKEIERIGKSRWVMPSVTMVLGGVLVFLINFALTH
jgi:uncharacterized membrane protein YwaF